MKTARLLQIIVSGIILAGGVGAYALAATGSPRSVSITKTTEPSAVVQSAPTVPETATTPAPPQTEVTDTEPTTSPATDPEPPVEPEHVMDTTPHVVSGCGQMDNQCITIQETN